MRASVLRRLQAGGLLIVLVWASMGGLSAAAQSSGEDDEAGAVPSWQWPLEGRRAVTEPYRAPAHEYGAGHRGIDLPAAPGMDVRAPAAGVVAFRGVVVDRPLVTIDHGGGLVSTFEPVQSPLSPGDVIEEGQVIGQVHVGGHARAGTVHLGVRSDGAYINPMLLFGGVPRAVLLPCCAPL